MSAAYFYRSHDLMLAQCLLHTSIGHIHLVDLEVSVQFKVNDDLLIQKSNVERIMLHITEDVYSVASSIAMISCNQIQIHDTVKGQLGFWGICSLTNDIGHMMEYSVATSQMARFFMGHKYYPVTTSQMAIFFMGRKYCPVATYQMAIFFMGHKYYPVTTSQMAIFFMGHKYYPVTTSQMARLFMGYK